MSQNVLWLVRETHDIIAWSHVSARNQKLVSSSNERKELNSMLPLNDNILVESLFAMHYRIYSVNVEDKQKVHRAP
jgi:hypothetical protein